MIKQFKNDALIKLLMAFIAIEAMMASILAIAESNIEIDKAIQQAREEIKMNGHRKGHHILIVKAVTKDQKAFTGQQVFGVKAELQRWLGYRRRSISNDEYKFYIGKPGVTYELRVMAPGYHQFSREITFGEEQVVIWENVVLEPVTSDTASTITGTLWLESSKDKLGGVIVRADDSRTITDDNGRFTLSGLRSADLTISAKVEGYIGLGEWVNLKKASKINVDLKGYRKRKYKIEWAHQDSGSWDFNENRVKKRISILENRDGIRFSEGVINDNREVDFFILQTKDKVEIHNNYRASFYESDIPFEKLNMVPVSAIPLFKGNRRKLVQLLEPDKTFVFRTRDGTFAKMVVLEEHIAQTYSGRPTHMFVSLEDAPSEKQNIKLWMVDTSDNKLIWNSSIQAPGTFDISDLPKKVVFPDKDFYLFLESDRYVSQAHRLTKVDGQLLFFKNIDSIKLSLKRYAVIEYAFFEGNNTEFTGREPTTSGLVTVGPGGSLPHFGRNLRFGERSDPTRFGSGLRFDCYGNSPNKGVTLPVETLYDKMSKAPEQGYRCNHIATSIAIAKNKGFYTKVVDNKGEAIRFGKIYVKDIVTEPTKGTALRIDRQLICGDRGPKKQVDFLWDSMWYGNYSGSLGPLNAALKLLTMQDESMDMLERELLPLTLSEERLRRYLKDMESEDDCIRQEAVTKLQYYDPRLASNSFEIMGKISSRLVRLEIAGMLMGKGLNHYKTNGSYDIKIKRKGLGSGSFELQAIGPNSQILSISNPNKRISDIRKIEWKRVLLALSVIQFMDDKERVKKILKSVSSGHIDALPTQYARSIYKRNYSFFSFQNTSISEQVEALYRDDHLAIEAIMSLSQASDEAIHALKPLVRNSLEQGKSKEIQKHLYAFLLLLEKIDTPESIAMIRVVADGDPKIPYTQAAQAIYNRITRSNHYSVPFNLARE